ncbi:hypothetical protein TRIP_B120022 [uncultured Desulfatiglans sp.]|uniref:Uncharacterized protein n=1 Tax=Uncultured Desulfatiglans sp. TaxID=1748965 RepID=A0A653A0L8_UNCDX|nr:hypothetical protein TRIP_B120022 [uncultured Desulfatiglans sp.]
MPVQKGSHRLINIPIELVAAGLEFKIEAFALVNQFFQLAFIGVHSWSIHFRFLIGD